MRSLKSLFSDLVELEEWGRMERGNVMADMRIEQQCQGIHYWHFVDTADFFMNLSFFPIYKII